MGIIRPWMAWQKTSRGTKTVVALCYHKKVSQPVKLSDALVLDARVTGKAMQRSIAGQVEFWARLGRSVEWLLNGQKASLLGHGAIVRPLSSLLKSVDSPAGRKRVTTYLQSQPFPHYRVHPHKPGLLERVDEDGTRTVGRFVNRRFKPVRDTPKADRKAKN
jgi:ParD-like antitoxin of type II bacterial toxin-antitoxin system